MCGGMPTTVLVDERAVVAPLDHALNPFGMKVVYYPPPSVEETELYRTGLGHAFLDPR